jgi:benzil reductase ((S)-benzoin forming)
MLRGMGIHLNIVTGASRGLGHAVARRLLERGEHVLTLARGTPSFDRTRGPAGHEHWSVDLADARPVAARLEDWLRAQHAAGVSSAVLINNAAVVNEPAPLDHLQAADLAQAVRVGLEAPLVLTSAFLRATRGWTAQRKVLFVSSGLGRRAMASCASYCAVKAGLDHLARSLSLEQAAAGPAGARIVSLAPGIIDTDMQVQLRAADPALFADRHRFVGFKESGQLDSPADAAAKLVAYLDRADFGSEPVSDVRQP